MRLDKAVALAGLTRSQAKEAIRRGRVTVNGKAVTDGAQKIESGDRVALDGDTVSLAAHHHFMLNKPAGVLTATRDEHGERTILNLLPENLRFRDLGPVGRLDKDVTGLVILTDDGELAHRLISPRRGIEKQYLARTEGKLTDADVRAFENGIELKDFTARPAHLEILEAGEEASLCRVTVSEGKFHQVKRMLGARQLPVLTLHRLRIGGLWLDESLAPGEYRTVSAEEIRSVLDENLSK